MEKIRIVRERTRYHEFAFEFQFDRNILQLCRTLKEKVGWKEFTFFEKKWRCVNAPTILEFIKLVGDDSRFEFVGDVSLVVDSMREHLSAKRLMKLNTKRLKNATDTDFEVRNVKGTLYPYQKVGVEFLVNSGCKAILGDACGVGKSCQALATVAHLGFKRILVICPASVKFAWENETEKWTDLVPRVISSGEDPDQIFDDPANVFIINYDLIFKDKMLSRLQRERWDCIVCDESHLIKARTAKRSRAVKILSQTCPRVLFLSGTPFLNCPEELFTSLNIIDPLCFGDYYKFTKKFCDGHRGQFGWEARGATNIEELKELIDKYFIRRTKEEVLKDLPKKLPPINIPIKLSPSTMKEYVLAHNKFVEYMRVVKKTPPNQLKNLDWGAQRLMRLNELRMITTRGKMDAAKEVIENVISSGEKIVVFSCYREPLTWLKEALGDASVLITGEIPVEERGELVRRFQEDPSVLVFLGGMKSAGVGITLTAASNVLFIDYSWTPADHIQAQDRCHRIGSKGSSINTYQIYAWNTIDEKMVEMLNEKQRIFDILIEGKANEATEVRHLRQAVSQETSIEELLNSMRKI